MTLIYLSLSFLLGIYIGSQRWVDPQIIIAAGLVAIIVALIARKYEAIRIGALCVTFLAVGLIRYQTGLPPADAGSIALHVGPRPVEIGAVVVAEPDIRDEDVRLVVSAYHIGSGQDSYPVAGRIQVRVPRYASYRYGDDLLLKGELLEPPEYDTFSYKEYLLRQGIYAIMYFPQVKIVARDQGNHVLAALYTFKQRLQESLVVYVPEPQAGLAQGILLGVKATLNDDLKNDLTQTGLTHIVVVSGYNLTVVAALLQRLVEKRLRRSLALLIALAGVVAFTIMSGASVAVVRAAIMVSMALVARGVGRESDALTSLLFTAALLVGANPLTLWDVSFQLSFLATAGLVLLSPPLDQALQRIPLGIGGILATTIAAQLTTLPVIALNFQRISLISPLANLLVQPAIPPMMVSGAIVAFAGLTGHVAVNLAGWITWLLGAYAVQVMRVLGDLPWAAVDIPVLPFDQQTPLIVVYFATIALFLYMATHVTRADIAALLQRPGDLLRRTWRRLAIVGLATIAAIVWLAVAFLLRSGS